MYFYGQNEHKVYNTGCCKNIVKKVANQNSEFMTEIALIFRVEHEVNTLCAVETQKVAPCSSYSVTATEPVMVSSTLSIHLVHKHCV